MATKSVNSKEQIKMKKQFLEILSIALFLSVMSCATRSTPPAQVVNASNVPPYAQTPGTGTAAPGAVTTPAAPAPAKLEAVTDDEDIKTTTTNTPPPATNQAPATAAAAAPAAVAPATAAKPAANAADGGNDSSWKMPTAGTLGAYSASTKGVDITGSEGQPIAAVADGKVLYSGNGLKGYGNLIIIRHDNTYLSAYAYNKTNLVKEGTMVKQGQNIATMGRKDNQAMLHLEVRKNGKPVDPHTMIGN
jgi:lipoprotein NlpD